ncbi:MAG: hypothetical protein IKM31_00130, partial [Oscillospiraceae bacterium]|nr:hypothetical protein [Oscillospiraceae bacterium]
MPAKKTSMPTGITIETEEKRYFTPFCNPAVFEDITVLLVPEDDRLAVRITAETSAVRRVTLHWAEPLPEDGVVLGGAWERGYGDLEWRHYNPERA